MSKVAIVFWSGTGNTQAMAAYVAQGVQSAGEEADTYTSAEFDAAKAAEYDKIAFGCPSMGVEQLEETEFQPMWDEVKGVLGGKKIVLFGSYGWGSGEWMDTWRDEASTCGCSMPAEPVICNATPDAEGGAQCEALGKALAEA